MLRIQKILLAEFKNIYESVLVENPFTQVDENGYGLKQYHIGVTYTKILFGVDNFISTNLDDIYSQNIDPEIETFELTSLIPLQLLKFQFYRKRNRYIMQLTPCLDGVQTMYFEFGGHMYKNLFWNTWREHIATVRLQCHPTFFHISGMSPFSSSDVLADEEIFKAVIHAEPRRAVSVCLSHSGSL
ncbi:uncharacterized protein LOC119670343 [Teleopsis dalmanni]|uniref:uncharacterized protein LOC119670343 n=1 Tax=Teleopsis dalmanni TaxID=139649 RepID=UPI0018CF4805|nr:uncharacterized protein LOC119670343 [Teleopsis dalmanni]